MSRAQAGGERRALEERLRIVRRDLEELAQQVADGEIDPATAAGLETGYRAELAQAERALAALPAPAAKPGRAPAAPPAARPGALSGPGRRILWAMGALVLVLTGAIVFLATRDGDDGAAAPTSLPADLPDAIAQMEAVVAAHPDNNAMRLALADLYFEQGRYGDAVGHYIAVLENSPTSAEESEALARVGWLAYYTGQFDAAVATLEQAIAVDPAYGLSKLYLGEVLLCGKEDPAAALPYLEEVLTYPDFPADLRPRWEGMVEQARAGIGGCAG